ncbi:MAG TPA: aromatic acid/H+ symport family MFS transporter [Pseudonocardia sp.]|jgi:MFS family permease|uniref:MFS transporter n=1 Tax=Pseudonocardia sp. TaxID=60912 RepID=UPI002631BBA2|nr:aromatic acid/H+ symport family MFS transporter [Pseudonocardia sp.]HEV7469600.1 aromatic acid/H+ symport family MFS transporter [Pseudonocardia sp.]
MSGKKAGSGGRGSPRWVAPLCWTAVALEGFDLVVLGVVLPSLLRDPAWGLNPATASLISVVGLLGVMVGALGIGPLTDRFGRRRMMLITVTSFSVLTLLCAFATGPVMFGVLRFLAGLGLGGVLPVALAMVNEFARVGKGGSATTTMMTGYHVGAVVTALLGILVIPSFGWRAMFVIGALPALVLVPLIAARLPESLTGDAVAETAEVTGTRNPVAALFRGGYLRATLAFWVTSFMGLLLVYGLNTWLPEIMRSAGYELGAALALLLVLNVGAVVGLLVAGRVADRMGLRKAVIGWFTAAAVFLALLSIRLPGIGVYVSVLLAGVFVFSSQVLVYAAISRHYPAAVRATALGAASGIGRLGAITGPLIGGALLTAGIAYPWGFYVFALVAALGAVAVAAVGRIGAPTRKADA